MSNSNELIDSFDRKIDYLRISLTDRCNFRCVYCMAEDMEFLPRNRILSLEEVFWIAQAFSELGVRRFRFTGGEPLVRQNMESLLANVAQLSGTEEVTLTTNGALLSEKSARLVAAGVKRINISLDSLSPHRFRNITRTGSLKQVLEGIAVASQAGFDRIKLNCVIMRGQNEDEILPLLEFALKQQLDISFIEEMPLGNVGGRSREQAFVSSDEIRETINSRYRLESSLSESPGPSRYFSTPSSAIRIGFISPHSHNFCASCNRVRLTAEGRLLLCLGNEHSLDLRKLVREHPGDIDLLKQEIIRAVERKPERHEFSLSEGEQLVRFMNMTGG